MADHESGIWVPPGGSADPRREPPDEPPGGDPRARPPTPEDVAEQLRRLKPSDVVVSLLPTLAQLAYSKLEPASRDLAEARVAIDAIGALLRVLDEVIPAELTRDFQQVVVNLQVAYAAAAGEPREGAPPGDG
ncbi:MAG: hypothetical protein ICV59_10040 [Thermoleophilia bacterium]|nr:hypothetical protein [Thermoleophilia bacterium]